MMLEKERHKDNTRLYSLFQASFPIESLIDFGWFYSKASHQIDCANL